MFWRCTTVSFAKIEVSRSRLSTLRTQTWQTDDRQTNAATRITTLHSRVVTNKLVLGHLFQGNHDSSKKWLTHCQCHHHYCQSVYHLLVIYICCLLLCLFRLSGDFLSIFAAIPTSTLYLAWLYAWHLQLQYAYILFIQRSSCFLRTWRHHLSLLCNDDSDQWHPSAVNIWDWKPLALGLSRPIFKACLHKFLNGLSTGTNEPGNENWISNCLKTLGVSCC